MKKLLIMISAMTAAVFSTAKADVTVSGSAGLAMVSGGNVLDGTGNSRSTSGTLFEQGGAVSFAMSTTTAGGMTVSTSGGITMDSNDATDTKAVSGLAAISFAADGFTLTVGDIDLPAGGGVGEVGAVATAHVDNGGYTQTGIVTGVSDTEGYGFTASTTVGSASVTFGYLLDKAPEGSNNAESASGDYGSGVTVAMPMGDMTVTLGYANVTGTADETTAGASVSYALGGGTLSLGYESTDEATDSSSMSAAYSGSLDADTTYAVGYTDGEQGSLASTQTEVNITRSLGGGVSVFGELQSNDGSGTSGTNIAVGTTFAF
tara:strand:+ start:1620 stop:2576 length:957 start_codon:yes stop_codon:yes gene_type:complete